MLHDIAIFLKDTIIVWGYLGIIILMFLESSFFPFPSEIVMIPAGMAAFDGKLDPTLAVACGIFGSLLGGWFNYYLSLWLGRPALVKFGKYFLLNEKKFDKIDGYFDRHGEITTFVGRLIPGIRQLISCPAGLARMNILRFTAYTGAGAGIWVVILVAIGWVIGKNGEAFEEVMKKYTVPATVGALIFCAVLVAFYVWRQRRKAPNQS